MISPEAMRFEPERIWMPSDLKSAISKAGIDSLGQGTIMRALQKSHELHFGQLRRSGAPYIQHPLAAAMILIKIDVIDVPTLTATLFHDAPEDTFEYGNPKAISHVKWEANIKRGISREFDMKTAEIVMALQKPKINNIDVLSEDQATGLWLAKLAEGPVEALMVKMAERLHNLRTLRFLTEAEQKKIVADTVKLLFPIFERAFNTYPIESRYLMEEMDEAIVLAERTWKEPLTLTSEARELQ